MRLIGVDVGGTFTDLVYADTEAGRTAVHKISTTPDDPSRGVVAGADGALRQVRHPARDHRRGVPRHDHRHQRHPRARRRRDRHDHHRRLSRYPAYRPPPAAAALLDHAGHPLAGPAAGQAPPSQDGEGAAGAAAGRGAGAARRGRRPPGGARAKEAGVQAIAICFLFSYLDPAHEARAHGDRARGISRVLRHDLLVGVAAVPRVRALHHDGDERLRRAQGAQLRDAARDRDRGLGLQGRPAHHGVQRRRGDAGDGGRAAGAHPALGPGGRRDRRRLGGRPVGPAQPHHLRCRRHLGRYRHRDRRRLRRGDGARHLDRGLPRDGADDRRAHDRRRRRLDRLRRPGRRLQGRTALGRRRAGTGRLRPGRQPRHRDRRQRRAGPARQQATSWAAACRSTRWRRAA